MYLDEFGLVGHRPFPFKLEDQGITRAVAVYSVKKVMASSSQLLETFQRGLSGRDQTEI
jgi:hypothetical protein